MDIESLLKSLLEQAGAVGADGIGDHRAGFFQRPAFCIAVNMPRWGTMKDENMECSSLAAARTHRKPSGAAAKLLHSKAIWPAGVALSFVEGAANRRRQ